MLSQKVLKPGPVQRVDPELETGRVQEKTRYDPVDPAIRSKTLLQPVNFCFFTKTALF
jgi:hypothetical protein